MAQSWSAWCWQLRLASSLAIGGALAYSENCALTQIIQDATLGSAESSVVKSSVVINGLPSDQIDGGATRGVNLFHSFQQFNVDAGRGAYFTNPAGIENIISRVTGGNPSNILGTLGVTGGNANLFLINPNGIVFGQNARLDVRGSFLASTASSVKLADGTQFSATEPQTIPLLTISVPTGLQFGENAGRILVQGQGQGIRKSPDLIDTPFGLHVQPNQTLAMVGGDIALLGGTLKTAGGRIELGSVASPSLVSLTSTDKGWTLSYEGVQNFRDIQLSQQAAVDASGAGGGNVQVQGRRVTLTDGSQIEASTLGSEPGGTLSVTASELVELIGQSATTQFPTYLVALVYPGATGTGGNVTLKTGRLMVGNGAVVRAGTLGQGQGGNLTVTASESVDVMGTGILPRGQGRFPSGLFTQSNRDRDTQTDRVGDAGNLRVVTRRLSVRDGAVVSASTSTEGKGGNLAVKASESVELIGTSPDPQFHSGLYNVSSGFSTQNRAAGAAGNLTLETEQLIVRDGAQVNVSSVGTGNAGNLEVAASSIRLDNEALLSSDTRAGQGNISLRSQDLVLRRGSNITSDATGTATGGNITIDTGVIAALENSDIRANSEEAFGGRVIINAQGIFGTEFRNQLTPLSDITASSNLGPEFSGTVEINTPYVDPSRGLATLPAELVDASGLIAQSCPAGVGPAASKFVVTGRGGLPPTPRETLSSDTVLEDWGTLALASAQPQNDRQRDRSENRPTGSAVATAPTRPTPAPLVEAQGWVIGANGEVILTATAPTVTSHSPWLTLAACHGK